VPWSIGHEGGSKVRIAHCLLLMSKQHLTGVVGSILKDEVPRGDEDGLRAYGAVGPSMPQSAHPVAFAEQANPETRAWQGFRRLSSDHVKGHRPIPSDRGHLPDSRGHHSGEVPKVSAFTQIRVRVPAASAFW
jgi:hypothetical protein